MRFSLGLGKGGVRGARTRLAQKGVDRRQFLKFCSVVAVSMGLGPGFAGQVAHALTGGRRPSVVYLHGAECTGCSESVLRTVQPYLDALIFDTISLDYHETLMAAAGAAAEEALHAAVHAPEGFICIVEGAIPCGAGGWYGSVGGRTMLDLFSEIVPQAREVIAYGTCASFGGIQAAAPNPTEAKGINDALGDLGVNAINIGGCPPNPYNLVGTLVHLIQHGEAPDLDEYNRPDMFFDTSVHDLCERLPHFEAREFAPSFDSPEARQGWCLYELGCKGPNTYNNCPKVKFNQTNWPVQAGHPCIGCSEPDFWDEFTPFYDL